MAGTDWQSRHPLATDLLQNAKEFSFFQAVRLLHGLHPDAPRLGHQGPPEAERIRLRPELSLVFPNSDIAEVEEIPVGDPDNPQGWQYRITVTFMGLYGTSSPLPVHYTEDMIRADEHESLLRGFIDLFHHRILSLLYRVWEKYRHGVQYSDSASDYYSRRILQMVGVDLERLPQGMKLRPGRLPAYAGLLTQEPRSAASLQAILSDHFPEGRVEVQQCKGRWVEFPAEQRSRLGVNNCRLGADCITGDRVWDVAGNFGVQVGPLAIDDYMNLLPDGDASAQFRELVDLFNGDCLDYELTLLLRGEEVPALQLGAPTARLGWSSWLGHGDGQNRATTFKFSGWKHG